MRKTIKNYWDKTSDLRNSIPNFYKELKKEDPEHPNDNIQMKINRKLLKYKEIKILYEKTGIHPIYFLYILLICLLFIFIGFFDHFLTILIATVYPLYISYKTLQNHINDYDEDENENEEDSGDNINDIIQWLSYWVVYSIFINFETIFKKLLIYIPFYFFIKVIFLLFCFLPQYQLSGWIYNKFIRDLFIKYEKDILDVSNQFINNFTKNDKNQNLKKNLKKNFTMNPKIIENIDENREKKVFDENQNKSLKKKVN